MNIDSLRGLKAEISTSGKVAEMLHPVEPLAGLLTLAPELLETRTFVGAMMRPLAPSRRRTVAAALKRRRLSLAMGVARGRNRNDYFLGARIQGAGARARALAAHLAEKSAGECDVRLVAHVRALSTPGWFRRTRRPLEAGLSVGLAGQVDAGTLGFIVEDGERYYALSNNHVLANVNRAQADDPVVQPGALDRTPSKSALIGALHHWVPISFQRQNEVDAAIAQIFDDLDFYEGWTEALPGLVRGTRRATRDDLDRPVVKVGRTTGVTRGKITQVEVEPLVVEMTRRHDARFRDVIEVMGEDGVPLFSDDGDSGSLVVGSDRRAVGLLFAGGDDEQGRPLTYLNPIETVLARLGVRLAI